MMSLAALGSSLVLAASLTEALTIGQAAAATSVTVATGTVHDASGALAKDAVVDLYAWPSDQVLQALKPGEEVPRTLIASAKTSSAGVFSLTVGAQQLSAVAVSGAYANLEVDSGTSSWFITQPVASWAPMTVHLAGAANSAVPAYCIVRYQNQLHRRWGTIAQEYDWGNAGGVSQTVTYDQSQSTSLSIGISNSGKYGTFTASGSESETTATGQGFPTQHKPGFYHFRTWWRIAKYLKVCGGKIVDGKKIAVAYKHIVRSNGWIAGDDIRRGSQAPRASLCTIELAGSPFHTSNEKAATVSAGLTIAEVNFNVNMQTGYDTSSEVSLFFNKQRHLCGTGGKPAPAAGILVIKK
jgi:hypothetical protein